MMPNITLSVDEEIINSLKAAQSPYYEPCVNTFLQTGDYEVTDNDEYAINNSDISFIVVGTPVLNGKYDLCYIWSVLENIVEALKKKEEHIVVINSTVYPGSMKIIDEYLTENVGRKVDLYYNPVFISLGNAVSDFQNPEIVIIGCSDGETAGSISDVWNSLIGIFQEIWHYPEIYKTNYTNAELAKMAFNFYSVIKLNFTNLLTNICETIPSANADTILNIIKRDSRIGGGKLFKSGLGYGGPCLPVDNDVWERFMSEKGQPSLPSILRVINNSQVKRVLDKIPQEGCPVYNVAILGLTYKPNTQITMNSQAFDIARRLTRWHNVTVYDPGLDGSLKTAVTGMTVARSVEICIENADYIIVDTPWNEFKNLSFDRECTVIDCWNLYKDSQLGDKINYIGSGIGYGQ